MKKYLFVIILLIPFWGFAQSNFDNQISKAAIAIVKKAASVDGSKRQIGILPLLEVDGSTTFLGKFLSDELLSELSNQSNNQNGIELSNSDFDYKVLKRNSVVQWTSEPNAAAKLLGNLKLASIVVYGQISDFDGSFRVNLKLYETQNGNEIGSIKINFDKSETLTSYHNKPLESESRSNTSASTPIASTPITQKPQNCPTGDFCFENTSKKRKIIRVLGRENPLGLGGNEILYEITILPGEKGCFYSIPAVVHNIDITTFDSEEPDPNNWGRKPQHVENRQIRVVRCATESDLKPLKL